MSTKPAPYDSHKAEVWSVGVTLCYMLTGQPPFLGRSAETVRKSREERIIHVTRGAYLDGLSPATRSLINAVLTHSLTDRPTANAVLDMVQEARLTL